jgi:predicted DNA-binding transcriptional regulator AlpA
MTLQPIAVDKETAANYVSLSVTTLELLVRQGEFPPPRQIAARRVAFIVSELSDWLSTRPVSQLLPPINTGAPKPR